MSEPRIAFVHDLVEGNGKTVKENNLEKKHAIPLKTFVEVNCEYNESHGCRGFVVEHQRDCDGSPMYGISLNPEDADRIVEFQREVDLRTPYAAAWLNLARSRVSGGWGEESLVVIDHPSARLLTPG